MTLLVAVGLRGGGDQRAPRHQNGGGGGATATCLYPLGPVCPLCAHMLVRGDTLTSSSGTTTHTYISGGGKLCLKNQQFNG